MINRRPPNPTARAKRERRTLRTRIFRSHHITRARLIWIWRACHLHANRARCPLETKLPGFCSKNTSRLVWVWDAPVIVCYESEQHCYARIAFRGRVATACEDQTTTRTALSLTDLEKLQRLDTCTVSNAIERLNVRLRNEGFVSGAARMPVPEFRRWSATRPRDESGQLRRP